MKFNFYQGRWQLGFLLSSITASMVQVLVIYAVFMAVGIADSGSASGGLLSIERMRLGP